MAIRLFDLSDREGKIGIREGLVLQGEVPPLAIEGLEAVSQHSLSQYHAVLELFGGDATTYRTLAVVACVFARFRIAAEVRMALWAEPVEGTAHVELFFRLHVE